MVMTIVRFNVISAFKKTITSQQRLSKSRKFEHTICWSDVSHYIYDALKSLDCSTCQKPDFFRKEIREAAVLIDTMAQNYTSYPCFPRSSGIASILVSIVALPFQILLVKLLVKDVGLVLPRHKILLTLTISDVLQMFAAAMFVSVAMALKLTTESATCSLLRDLTVFTSSLTIVVSSLAVVTFSIERVITCMNFLKYRRLFKRTRVTKLLYSYWLFGAIIAAIAALTNDAKKTETSVNETTSFQIVCASVILPSATIIIIIYSRILLFSRGRILQVAPSSDSSKLRTVATFRKKQMRIAFIAGIVCIAYVVCMVPVSVNFFLELTGIIDNHPGVKKILICIVMLNTIADPFIYGFGMIQTRLILFRFMKSVLPEKGTVT